jgi:starch synthase
VQLGALVSRSVRVAARFKMRIVQVASEVSGLATTGGLGDAVLGLSHALVALGDDVLLVTPRYGTTRLPPATWHERDVTLYLPRGPWRAAQLRVYRAPSGLRFGLVEHEILFGHRAGVYGDSNGEFGDNLARFVLMSRAALEASAAIFGGAPDVVHAHDWHASASLLELAHAFSWPRTVRAFTIHNLAHQGALDARDTPALALPAQALEHHDGGYNLMKAAITAAEIITTVSPRYAWEITTPEGGFGLDGHLRHHAHKLTGIVNGVDIATTGPAFAAYPYAAEFVTRGKAENKRMFREELGLAGDGPLFGAVARLTEQKGIDVLLQAVPALVARGASVVVVGVGDRALEAELRALATRYPTQVRGLVAFDSDLATRVFAASDFLLMPSRFEPCGLTQLYAMMFGTLPVVTRTGGLIDTVTPIAAARDEGVGFFAEPGDVASLLLACEEAMVLYRDREGLLLAQRRAMQQDFSWRAPATRYRDLFLRARASRA